MLPNKKICFHDNLCLLEMTIANHTHLKLALCEMKVPLPIVDMH